MARGYVSPGTIDAKQAPSGTSSNAILKGHLVVLPAGAVTDELTVVRCAADNSPNVLGVALEDNLKTDGTNAYGGTFRVAGSGAQCLVRNTSGATIAQGDYIESDAAGGVQKSDFAAVATHHAIGKMLMNCLNGDLGQAMLFFQVYVK